MRCPACGGLTKVIDSRPFGARGARARAGYEGIYRRRECERGHTFSTVELPLWPKNKKDV